MKSTLDEIARCAGVSAATVSRVLNGRNCVAAATRDRVIAAAKNCRYAANWHVSSKPLVAIVTSNFGWSSYCAEIITHLTDQLQQHGYQAAVIAARDTDMLATLPVCGIISLLYPAEAVPDWQQPDIPVVCINNTPHYLDNVYSSSSDLRQGIHIAVEHLYNLGHRRIGTVFDSKEPPYDSWGDRERLAGFQAAIHDFHLEGQAIYRYFPSAQLTKPYAQLLDQGITALICSAYGRALPTYQALQLLGCRIPEDVSLIIREEADITTYLMPEPTVLRLDLYLLAQQALTMLQKLITGENTASKTQVEYQIAPGFTTAAPPTITFAQRRRQLQGNHP